MRSEPRLASSNTSPSTIPVERPSRSGRSASELVRVDLPDVPHDLRADVLAVARRACPRIDAEAYLATRFEKYQTLWCWRDRRRVTAFLLSESFEEDGALHVYLGPLFSRGRGGVDLVVALARRLLVEHPTKPIHMLAELQSPEALLMLSRLFRRSSRPRMPGGEISDAARLIAATFARRVRHIGAVDPTNLSTRSKETLFHPLPRLEPVVQWLLRRGVDLRRGDSQVLVVRASASIGGRARIWQDLASGSRALSRWQETRREMIASLAEELV
jgi:hypothetical protein